MKDNQTKYPQLRFKGFTDPWEERKLGEIVAIKITNGLMNRPGGNLLAVKDINVVNMYTPDHIHVEDLEYFNATDKDLSRCDVTRGDVFVTRSSLKAEGIAEPNVLLENGRFVFDDHLMRLKPRPEINPYFLKELLSSTSVKKQFIAKAKTATMTTIGQQDISTSDARFPSSTEQKLIAELLQKIDSTIALHQRKLAKLKELKHGYLQKLFPKNGSKFPQLRFAGFADAWEQRKLGEVATFINGRAYKQNELLDSGKYKVLRVGNFYTNDSWYYSNMELGDKYYIDKGDLVYTWSATFGPHIWNGEKVIYHYHIWKVELSKLLDRDFTLQLLEADKARLLSNTNGSTMIHVTKGDMESKSVTIPNIDEQNQIGTFFQQLDNLITLHQRKLEKLQELKKGYLQKMFC
jgi:type I restriction enzyme S subunit